MTHSAENHKLTQSPILVSTAYQVTSIKQIKETTER